MVLSELRTSILSRYFFQMSTILRFLSRFSCNSPLLPQGLNFICPEDRSVEQAFQEAIVKKTTSFPVVQKKDGKFVTTVTMTDLVGYFLENISEEEWKNPLRALYNRPEIGQTRVLKTKSLDPTVFISEETSLDNAVKEMVFKRFHRILILDSMQRPSNIFSQLEVLKIISILLPSVPKSKQPIKELTIGKKMPVCISEMRLTREGFALAIKQKISAVGVVDESGKLVGSLSITDIRLIGGLEGLDQLNFPLKKYLERIEVLSSERTIQHSQYPVVCRDTDTLDSIIEILIGFGIHRIYIVDDSGKPIGVVSLIDIITNILSLEP